MNVMTFEGVVENGRILLKNNVQLPNKTKVFVVVPSMAIKQVVRIYSPRLVHSEQINLLKKEIVPDTIPTNYDG